MVDYIEWTGTVKLPKGSWAETHEFAGEIRQVRRCEDYLETSDIDMRVLTWNHSNESLFIYPILRPKKPKWQPPAHLVGTGWRLRIIGGSGVAGVLQVNFYDDDDKWVDVDDGEGCLTPFGQAMQLDPNDLPDLQPGEEIVL